MSGLEGLRTRLDYRGGSSAERRFQNDKERSLKRSLLYSYQAETAILADGREFRCLINTEKTKADYDCKIISIPYRDVCLGRIDEDGNEIIQKPNGKTQLEEIGMKCGDVFKWKETDTYWIVFLEKIEEDAYFRAEIYKCEEEVTINDKKYHIYVRGPVETEIDWNLKQNTNWSLLNYSLVIYITKDDNTLDYFHRFQNLKIGNKNWEVKVANPYYGNNIIEVCLGEYFTNELNDHYEEQEKIKLENAETLPEEEKYIDGPTIVSPYERYTYTLQGTIGREWMVKDIKKNEKDEYLNTSKAIIMETSEDYSSVVIGIDTGKSGKFVLICKDAYGINIELIIEIKSI